MEYIEGTPLEGPLPVDQALKYAIQICDALDAAHRKGITHRDLKPANILVTKAGIKLLDFGLAKLGTAGTGQAVAPAGDAAFTMALTGKNEIVGTLYYMSPEQLQASDRDIDARSDIFSFGVVLYELITGRRAFEGSSPASVIAAIMERPAAAPSSRSPSPTAARTGTPTCFRKRFPAGGTCCSRCGDEHRVAPCSRSIRGGRTWCCRAVRSRSGSSTRGAAPRAAS
jgi:serine/threonine protein kinase